MGDLKYMKKASKNMAYLKAGFYGQSGSGKTHTSAKVAIGLHKQIGSKKPVAMFDTEPGAHFVLPMYEKAGIELMVCDTTRSFSDMMGFIREAAQIADICVVDSITHVWKEIQSAYLKKINSTRSRNNQKYKLEFHDWNYIKTEWGKFTDLFLSSKIHMIICGRAGEIYKYERNDDGKNELVNYGTKMATEKELGYEPSLLVEMYKEMDKVNKTYTIACTVEKDRADVMDGKHISMPTYEDFKPHIDFLNLGGQHFDISDNDSQDQFDVTSGEGWDNEKKDREIYQEKIQAILLKAYPAQNNADKIKKTDLIEQAFNTRSWAEVCSFHSTKLKDGYALIQDLITNGQPPEMEEEKPSDK